MSAPLRSEPADNHDGPHAFGSGPFLTAEEQRENPQPERSPLGRPRLLTPSLLAGIAAYIRLEGISDSAAGFLAGVSTSTLSRWKQEDEEVAIALGQARAIYEMERTRAIRQMTKRDGTLDWRAQAWLLQHSSPETYGTPSRRRLARVEQELREAQIAQEFSRVGSEQAAAASRSPAEQPSSANPAPANECAPLGDGSSTSTSDALTPPLGASAGDRRTPGSAPATCEKEASPTAGVLPSEDVHKVPESRDGKVFFGNTQSAVAEPGEQSHRRSQTAASSGGTSNVGVTFAPVRKEVGAAPGSLSATQPKPRDSYLQPEDPPTIVHCQAQREA